MNLAHLHLLLNHVPTVGFAVGLCLFLAGLLQKDEKIQRVSLGILLAVAVLCIPAYLTGVAASEILQDRPGISGELMEAHQDAALSAFALMELAGGLAWLALWQFRRYAAAARPLLIAIVLVSAGAFALMAQAANLGGGIRHPEIVSLDEAAATAPVINTAWLKTSTLRSFINDTSWVWPASEAIHFIGLGLAFGVVLLLNLRVLGMMKGVSFADLHRALPWGMIGFAINLVTGMLFFIGVPGQYTNNAPFQWKIVCLVLLGANLIYFTSLTDPWRVEAGADAPRSVKVMAASAIVLWLGVVYFGRMLPYLGGAY